MPLDRVDALVLHRKICRPAYSHRLPAASFFSSATTPLFFPIPEQTQDAHVQVFHSNTASLEPRHRRTLRVQNQEPERTSDIMLPLVADVYGVLANKPLQTHIVNKPRAVNG